MHRNMFITQHTHVDLLHVPQVFLHYSILNEHHDVLTSTLRQNGGSGQPQPFVIGHGRRMLRGMELGVLGK